MAAPPRATQQITLEITIAEPLQFLLARDRRLPTFEQTIYRQASLKDVIESLGVPHTEIGRLRVNGHEVGFDHRVADGETIHVEALATPRNVLQPSMLRPVPLTELRFLVDVNVARLGKLLRLVGCDTFYDPDLSDTELARLAAAQGRVLLTRDRALLRHGCIDYGHLVRAEKPRTQLREVVRLFGLREQLRPFSRCMHCNAALQLVSKSTILDQLQPLTIRYYNDFMQCSGCGKIYWEGSHQQGLEDLLTEALW